MKVSNKSNMFWTIYKKIEKDVISLSYYIHFSDQKFEDKNGQIIYSQIWTYSNQIADLLLAICTQIESLFLQLYKVKFDTPTDSIGTAIRQINHIWNLSNKQVKIISPNMYFTDVTGFGNEFAPMAYESHDENDYYSAYCALKHNRIEALHKANINALIRALAALFILNIYYSFEDTQIDEISEFDFTLGSDIFMVKFSINNHSSNDVLIIDEDEEYLKKLEMYANTIPDIDSGEFLRFNDENIEPQRYSVKINK